MEIFLLLLVLALSLVSLVLSLVVLRKLQWIFKASSRTHERVHKGFRQLFKQIQLRQILHDDLAFSNSLPPMGEKAASPDFLYALAEKIREVRPKVIVECGSGLSTIIAAKCLKRNGEGHLYSLEHLERFADQTRSQVMRHDLSDWATVIEAPLMPYEFDGRTWQWYDVANLPDKAIDILIVDGPPARIGDEARYPASPILFPRLSPRAVVILDDVIRQQEKTVIALWQREHENFHCDINERDFEKGLAILTRERTG